MAKLEIYHHNGLKFYCRPGTSDAKAYKEVIVNNSYQRKGFQIEPGETWLDMGGNVGAFAVLAASKGANVIVFEPDPISCEMIKHNLKANGLSAIINNVAVVGDRQANAHLSISKTGQYWRNSLCKDWGGGNILVECVNFNDVLREGCCIKMDIEGSEMKIVENWTSKVKVNKIVMEWSFDMDPDIDRYRKAVATLESKFDWVKADKIKEEHKVWLSSWFPPCKNIFAARTNT